ncbi:MAG: PepSY-like domain-containing protein [Aurantibacter sp.]
MKKGLTKLIVLMVSVLAIVAWASAQHIPNKVRDAFSKKFPQVSIVSWSKESNTEWEAEFDLDGVEYSAEFLEDGTWLETEHEIKKKDLPRKVKVLLGHEFSDFRISEVEISETKDGSFYEIELENRSSEMELVLDELGKIIKREEGQEDNEDNDD